MKKQVVYIGPTLPGIAEKNRIYLGRLPTQAREMARQNLYFKRLFVPVSRLIEARKELASRGSVLAVAYARIQEYKESL